MIPVTPEQIRQLAPDAKRQYLDALSNAAEILGARGINENALRVAHFIAQIAHETGGFAILTESMSYHAERIAQVWPSRFPSVASARKYEHQPELLANKVYGGRMGNVQPGDGWRFIGRGMLQVTGRESYERLGKSLGIDLAGNPDLAFDPRYSLAIAAEEWRASGCNAFADSDDVRAVTKAINGGYVGLDDRKLWLVKTKSIWR